MSDNSDNLNIFDQNERVVYLSSDELMDTSSYYFSDMQGTSRSFEVQNYNDINVTIQQSQSSHVYTHVTSSAFNNDFVTQQTSNRELSLAQSLAITSSYIWNANVILNDDKVTNVAKVSNSHLVTLPKKLNNDKDPNSAMLSNDQSMTKLTPLNNNDAIVEHKCDFCKEKFNIRGNKHANVGYNAHIEECAKKHYRCLDAITSGLVKTNKRLNAELDRQIICQKCSESKPVAEMVEHFKICVRNRQKQKKMFRLYNAVRQIFERD